VGLEPRTLRALLLGIAVGGAVLVGGAWAADRTAPIPVGDVAPEIRLGDQHGKAFTLVEVLKQRAFVVLAFYPKAFTKG
jgi:hypothetical protein